MKLEKVLDYKKLNQLLLKKRSKEAKLKIMLIQKLIIMKKIKRKKKKKRKRIKFLKMKKKFMKKKKYLL